MNCAVGPFVDCGSSFEVYKKSAYAVGPLKSGCVLLHDDDIGNLIIAQRQN